MATDARDRWRSARSYADLCELAARFFVGEVRAFPGWGAPELDEESDALVPALVVAARAGILPTASQPGRPFGPGHDGRSWAQRAFVAGFADEACVPACREATEASGLVLLVERDAAPGAHLSVGLRDGVPYLHAGLAAREEELALFEDEVGPEAYAELACRPFLWLVDPAWGRRERLPAALRDALG